MSGFKSLLLLTSTLLVVLGGCDSEDIVYVSGGGGPTPTTFSIETEPSLSADKQFLYYIAIDTLFPEKNGIWRAQVSSPRREQVLYGFGFHSPVLSYDEHFVAFLTGSTVNYLNLDDTSVSTAGVSGNYEALVAINDSIFIGGAGRLLYMINRNDSTVSSLDATGSDPTYYAPDQFVYVNERQTGAWDVHRMTVRTVDGMYILDDDVLDTLSTLSDIRWVSVEPSTNRYVYVEQTDTAMWVRTGQVGTGLNYLISRTKYVKPCFLGVNMVIFTGADGRFYQSDFQGRTLVPFWHAEDVE